MKDVAVQNLPIITAERLEMHLGDAGLPAPSNGLGDPLFRGQIPAYVPSVE